MKGGKALNQVSLVGRITKDIELKKLSSNREHASFVLAIDRSFRNANGEVEADFILCSTWGHLARNTAKHCGKGSLIALTGRIQSRYYEKEDQSRVYVTEIVANHIRFLSTKRRETAEISATAMVSAEKEQEYFHLPTQESGKLPIT